MKKNFFRKSFFFVLFGVLVSTTALGVVNWNGVASDVIGDTTLNINADSTISGAVEVRASGGNTVNVNLVGGGGKTLTGISDARLYLNAVSSSDSIVFNLTEDLLFTGDSDTTLLIVVSGDGEVIFKLSDTYKVSFSAASAGVMGAHLFVHMNASNIPTLTFNRLSTASANDVEVVVGPKSIMSYVAAKSVASGTADETGIITFDPANTSTGRMILRIQDTGAVYVAGSQTGNVAVPGMALSDIDLTTPAGVLADFRVQNSVGETANSSLLVINENETLTSYLINPWSLATPFDGVRYGFVLGANAVVNILDYAFMDYVGAVLDACPTPDIPAGVLAGRTVEQLVKPRNASAFIVDGNSDLNAVAARIQLGDASALVFRSGVDNEGGVDEGAGFLILPAKRSVDEGNILFDVEGELNIDGTAGSGNNKLEVLSWEVSPTGGAVLIGGSETKFPLRTFAQTSGEYNQYNAGSFFINNRVNLIETNLAHTDKAHAVIENDDINSEPTYVGGETFIIAESSVRPNIAFYNSKFLLHTCAAVTGVDLFVPNDTAGDNISEFVFYHNGIAYRDGSGRILILGTQTGSTSCDPCCSALSRDAHLDVFQEVVDASPGTHKLNLSVMANDSTIMPNVPSGIESQAEIHTIYLGHSSNISIGTAGGTFTDPVQGAGQVPNSGSTLTIDGNYFSFETRGGPQASPELSALSGRGGIFVDTNGTFEIGDTAYRASMATMVVKTDDGVVTLPLAQVLFDNRVGIADWQLDLTDVTQREIVSAGETLSDYTLNWRSVVKNYENTTGAVPTYFVPYEVANYDPCSCPAVVAANVAALPVVSGIVEQFQIKGSRLGGTAHLKINDGWVRELTFLGGCDSAEAPTAVVVLENDGRVGLGSTHKNRDSLGSSIFLGVNGVTLIANGNGGDSFANYDGVVDINEDIIINNMCHVLKGPNFDPDSETFGRLTFHSECCRSITVKKDGILDLTSFDAEQHIIEFGGNIRLILEPGAELWLGGATLRFTDNARLETAEVRDLVNFFPLDSTIATTDPIRVKISGTGKIEFLEDSVFFVGDNSYVGVESRVCGETVVSTNLTFDVGDRGRILVGSRSGSNNSVFQVGDTADRDATVDFTLNLSGVDSMFTIASRGFVGLGVGMADNFWDSPSDWAIDTLYNVQKITIDVPAGTFKHDRIFNSNSFYASLLAILDTGESTLFNFNFVGNITSDTTQATILGGGNMILVSEGTGVVFPTVQTTDGALTTQNGRLTVGLFSSKAILDAKNIPTAVVTSPISGSGLFDFWKTPDQNPLTTMYINASQDEHNLLSVGYADGGFIERGLIDEVVARYGITKARKDFDHTLSLGALFADVGSGTAPRPVIAAFELP